MSLKISQRFRKHPLVSIRGFSPLLAKTYEMVDVYGILSDLIVDPVTTSLRPVFHFFPSMFARKIEGPLVSVVVATRNNGQTIERSILSLLRQTYGSLQIIVIDDASDDASPSIVAKMAASDTRISVVTNHLQLGTGASRNIGLRLALGEFVTFHDGDDFSEPNRMAIQVEALRSDETKQICLCNYVRINGSGRGMQINNKRVMKCIISMMFRREHILNHVGYFIDESVSEDSDLYERTKIAFGEGAEVVVPRTLYRALYSRGSSFFSSVTVVHDDDRSVEFSLKENSVRAHEAIKLKHTEMRAGRISFRVE